MKDLTGRALNIAQQRGASYADVRVVERVTQHIIVKNGQVDALEQDESLGFGVRVLVNGAWGFASSSRMEGQEIERVVSQAVAIARASAVTKMRDVNLGAPVVSKGYYETPNKINPFTISLDEKIGLLLKADAEMRRVKGVTVAHGEMAFVREN